MLHRIDVRPFAPQVKAPTLVTHARGDERIPFDEGRLLASLIPGAQLVPLETRNHILLPSDPAFGVFFATLHEFLGSAA
jgi:pimeloyl-ACP methyl ester carboxylesterase